MKFHLGSLPDDFDPDETWHSIVEPNPLLMQFVALPIALVTAGLFFYLWNLISSFESLHVPAGWEIATQVGIIVSFPLLILIHECLHAICYPGYGLGQETLIGCWPSRMLFYAYYNGPMSRDRFLLVFAMPFLVISVVPLLVAAILPLPEVATRILAWFSIWNSLFACGDILGFFLILAQVPRGAIVRNKSWRSYWNNTLHVK